jgi:hypothetical protein
MQEITKMRVENFNFIINPLIECKESYTGREKMSTVEKYILKTT